MPSRPICRRHESVVSLLGVVLHQAGRREVFLLFVPQQSLPKTEPSRQQQRKPTSSLNICCCRTYIKPALHRRLVAYSRGREGWLAPAPRYKTRASFSKDLIINVAGPSHPSRPREYVTSLHDGRAH